MPFASARPQAFAALRKIARTLSLAWDLDTTLDLIVRQTTEVMHVDSCAIYLLDPESEILRLRATTGLAKRAIGRATLKVGEGMTGHAVQRNEPVFARDALHDPHFKLVEEAEEMVFHSLLAVPLVVEGRAIGAMNVQTVQAHSFWEEEVELLLLVSDLAAGALLKAQLYDSQCRQLEELRALSEISQAVTSPQYLDDILGVVTEMAAQTMNAAVCSIFLLNETGSHLELRSAKRTTSPYRPRPPIPLGEGVTGHVAVTGEPSYVRDVSADSRYLGAELARQEGLMSLLSVPLRVRERVIGVFNCYTAQVREFTAEQRALLITLANQTALAIENVRLVTHAAIVREMNHRIKNNLQTVAMLMQLQIPEAGQGETRRVLELNINRIHTIAAVHEVLSERGFSLVDVKQVLERVTQMTLETLAITGQRVQVVVEGEAILLPTRFATSLILVVNELVQNAIEHAFVGQEMGLIEVSLGRSVTEIVILVRDDGVGMPAHIPTHLGLEITQTLVSEELRGRIKFQARSKGTEISIRLPRELEKLG